MSIHTCSQNVVYVCGSALSCIHHTYGDVRDSTQLRERERTYTTTLKVMNTNKVQRNWQRRWKTQLIERTSLAFFYIYTHIRFNCWLLFSSLKTRSHSTTIARALHVNVYQKRVCMFVYIEKSNSQNGGAIHSATSTFSSRSQSKPCRANAFFPLRYAVSLYTVYVCKFVYRRFLSFTYVVRAPYLMIQLYSFFSTKCIQGGRNSCQSLVAVSFLFTQS